MKQFGYKLDAIHWKANIVFQAFWWPSDTWGPLSRWWGFPLVSSGLWLSVLSGVFICGVLAGGISVFSAGLCDVGLLGVLTHCGPAELSVVALGSFSGARGYGGTSHRLMSPWCTIVRHVCRQPMLCATLSRQDVVVSYTQRHPSRES